MNPVDLTVFVLYFLVVLGIGVFFYFRNKGADEYYIGGRKMGYSHVGLSVVATDVGGGFSIGLGGLGFVMGISGSWMLFTGLLGAWLAGRAADPEGKKPVDRKRVLHHARSVQPLFQCQGGFAGRNHIGNRIRRFQQLANAGLGKTCFGII